ncbi:hypothetical protein [Opitutus sp. ER46]|uniref:hypothetical protein n=1 Tax=Opitutus sp. ER46 TaxID=2161864 RepID=UPI000D306853|nr:hypothetical protein [Opitutus sp. ER46]PTX98478.1 hypothetical protein DB354_04205 [Opitutus sp. ER46]
MKSPPAFPSPAHSRHTQRGFVLSELVIVLVLSSVTTAALLAALLALLHTMQPQSILIGGETLPVAPTFGAFPSAVRLHQAFTDRVAAARAVYVLGGQHLSIPADAAPTRVAPLRVRGLPRIDDFSPGLPLDACRFQETYGPALGATEDAPSREDFSTVVVGSHQGVLAITCFVQVRRREETWSDGSATRSFVVREVQLWDIEHGAQHYAFAERPAHSQGVFVGAVHTWLRYQLNTDGEEGPACVAFPDPWIYGGNRGRPDDLPPFSRFSYLLAVSP